MYYKPHRLQVFKAGKSKQNSDGIWITSKGKWVDLCACRCDDNGAQKVVAVNGVAKIYNYHIVFERNDKHAFQIDEQVRVLDEDGNVRAEGTVIKGGSTNLQKYTEIYL